MKKTFAVLAIIALVVIVIIITFLKGGPSATPEPKISVMIGEQVIKPIYYGDRYNQTRDEIERFLDLPFEDGSWEALPYVELGDEVVIRFENFEVGRITISEDLLNQEGKFLYDDRSTQTYDVEVEDREIHFELKSNWAVHLSSNSESYKPGHVIRAFVIRAEVNRSNFAFAFVIRTNP